MTRVLIPAPAVEADVSAEQVEAYLLREGWVERDGHPGDVLVTFERSESGLCTWVPKDGHERDLARCIADIARAEQRHPSDVLADITGPARGVEGRRCRGADTREDYDPGRVACMVKMMAKRWRERSAPHVAQEESER